MVMQITFKDVTADYQLGPIRSANILKNVNLALPTHSFTAIVGHTGAGKSSLLKTINGLLLPRDGSVEVGEIVITADKPKKALKEVRQHVGMVFQFPEAQLFAETVEKDICFGPLNFDVPLEEAKKRTKKALEFVGLDETLLEVSPFSLSGGQQRRVAIAGILAMEPDVLILDEPGAGLDPEGKREILSMIKQLHSKEKLTTIIVTHDMDDVAAYADDVVVMEQGTVAAYQSVRDFFSDTERLQNWRVDFPEARKLQLKVEEETGVKLPQICLTIDELTESLIEVGLA
ncbi:energy-coupling factor transporter ATP-binding protein EcfA2 [Paraliobacillus quinghaiensis]|uniref:Energy-coupling factor transporter ATP-binding protein EcfA2 n=2 Tax=Paraliobacillus quinghaiensis TaxID=470815 RepID=A0A917WWX7_9BACI|nr:energy-coupling factor transporter ATP-binding protein EcfA2 [Paraliobacillus quinghaiensis]